MEDGTCPSRTLLRRGRQEEALFLKRETRGNCELRGGYWGSLVGWPWAYEGARPTAS